MATEKPFDKKMVRELAELLDQTNLTEIEVEQKGIRIKVKRAPAPVTQTIAPAPVAAAPTAPAPDAAKPGDVAAHPGAVTSPMVGTAYMAPEPGAERFVQVGSKVAEGETLLVVEAMKTFNPIPAPRAGTITAILVDDGQPVEYGEQLLIIE
ncbi:MAG: acetyl-CoA carboxylase biotin carboxyl carrier protein [Alphaproteobacteria bacterium]